MMATHAAERNSGAAAVRSELLRAANRLVLLDGGGGLRRPRAPRQGEWCSTREMDHTTSLSKEPPQ